MAFAEKKLTPEQIASIAEYGNVLRDIHARLVREGYFVDGRKVWNIFKCATPICEVAVEAVD